MIDREARDRAAALVEGFWTGAISNRELEDTWPDSRDRAVIAVFDFVWSLYDDFKVHSARDEDRENPRLTALMSNCLRFLRSAEPYTWPHYARSPAMRVYPRWTVIASFGLLGLWNRIAAERERQYWRDMRAHGDVDAWPFTQKQIG